jgi:glutamate/tyrosine decarboxylase-like PLP-dependent enzyme
MEWKFLKEVQFPQLELDSHDLQIIAELAERLQNNYPYHRAEYAGQMIKPAHALAQAAHWLTSFVNPNNHALDGGRATSSLEMESIASIAAMLGWRNYLGHLTSGGTTANLEALWVSRQADPKTTVLANENAHYTHSRMSEVLGVPYKSIPANIDGTMSLNDLERTLIDLKVNGLKATIVATLGTTGSGALDPLDRIIPLAHKYNARVHVDAAYGGYFILAELKAEYRVIMDAVLNADSVVIDPHKHGLQPYGCGAVLFRDPIVGRYYKHDSPYTYFTSSDLHLGEITLECSRAGASAAALWATLQKFPLVRGGAMSARLNQSLEAAQGLITVLQQKGFWTLPSTLDIVVYSLPGKKASEISAQNRQYFEHKAEEGIHLALYKLSKTQCPWNLEWDQDEIVVVRSVLMKPEHNDPELWSKISQYED